MQMYKRFALCFGHNLTDFWLDNARGLDVDKFHRVVVKRGKRSLLDAIRARWGPEGVNIIRRLLPKVADAKTTKGAKKPKPKTRQRSRKSS